MLRKILIVILLGASNASYSDYIGGISYLNLVGENRTEGQDVRGRIDAISASLNYEFTVSERLSIVPGVQIGTGLKVGNANHGSANFDVTLDQLFALTLRGEYDFKNRAYMFVEPTYVQVEYQASIFIPDEGREFTSKTIDETTLSMTAGFGYDFSKKVSSEVMLGVFDKIKLFQLGIRYKF